MKKILVYLIALFIWSCSGSNKETENVKNCFNNYKKAILNENGAEAIKFIDQTTIDYYAEMLEHAKTIESRDLQELSFLDKLMILSLRHRATADELNSFTGKKVIIWAIENGMIGNESVKNASIGKIEIQGTTAKGQFVNNNEKTPLYYKFNKEGETWKVDLTSIFPLTEKAMLQLMRKQNLTQQEFIYQMLEMVTGKEVNPYIWYKMVE